MGDNSGEDNNINININKRSFHNVQALRDPESNWGVDLAKNLEDYLLKICSGDLSNDDDNSANFSVNFAEAALLLQGSVQVYSRKVEYLYSLVLHALEFVSEKKQNEHLDGASAQTEESSSHAGPKEENDQFWGLDDIPVDAKNSLDSTTCKDAQNNHFIKPPANLVVLEGDCLDSTGDGSELESYLLATADLYRDFILLDPCDAIAVNDFLKSEKNDKRHSGIDSTIISKSRKDFLSPNNRSGGTVRKSTARKKQEEQPYEPFPNDNGFEFNNHNIGPDPVDNERNENMFNNFEMDDRYSEHGDLDDEDDEDEDDPWKPLNPHEPGNLRVKPFKKVKLSKRQYISAPKRVPITREFPLAKIHGTISSDLTDMWEVRRCAAQTREPQSLPFYEKLRESLVNGAPETSNTFGNPKDGNEDNDYDNDNGGFDFDPPGFDKPEDRDEMEPPMHFEKHNGDDGYFNNHEFDGQEDSCSQPNLEDLCRSHLDSLLASIAENEKQTELASRVSTWKQRIENNLEEQDSRPPFDIHKYGDRVLEKLPSEVDNDIAMSFTEVVMGQEKHDIARTFSALLQLVNNGNVDLIKNSEGNEPTCYTGKNPFKVKLLSHDKRPEKVILRSSKKRAISPANKEGCNKDKGKNSARRGKRSSSPLNSKLPIKIKKMGGIRCTPEGKRRRRSLIVEPVD